MPPATVAAGASISCPVSGTPTTSGAVTVTVTTGATNDSNGGTTAGGNNQATATITTSQSDMAIDLSGLPTTASIGTAYTGSFTCTNAIAPSVAATAATCSLAGLPAGLSVGTCTPATPVASLAPGLTISCPVTGTPTATGSFTLNGTTGASNDGVAANNTATARPHRVRFRHGARPHGPAHHRHHRRRLHRHHPLHQQWTATASATAASCAVAGLPAGVTVGACTPVPPATVAAGRLISCPVSGTPTTSGAVTVTVTTGATNDSNGGTTAGGNNQATATITTSQSDMAIDLSGLPTTASIGTAYTGSFTCTNANAPAVAATAATCSLAGLPAGLSVGTCTPATPVASLAPGPTISCPVTGTPTATGSFTLNGTTGASNDGVAANNTATRALAVSGSDMAPDLIGPAHHRHRRRRLHRHHPLHQQCHRHCECDGRHRAPSPACPPV